MLNFHFDKLIFLKIQENISIYFYFVAFFILDFIFLSENSTYFLYFILIYCFNSLISFFELLILDSSINEFNSYLFLLNNYFFYKLNILNYFKFFC